MSLGVSMDLRSAGTGLPSLVKPSSASSNSPSVTKVILIGDLGADCPLFDTGGVSKDVVDGTLGAFQLRLFLDVVLMGSSAIVRYRPCRHKLHG